LDTPAYLFVAYLTTLCYTQCCGGHDPNLFQCTRQEITRKIWTRCLQWYDLQTDSHKYRTISGAKIVTAFNCCVEVILASTVWCCLQMERFTVHRTAFQKVRTCVPR